VPAIGSIVASRDEGNACDETRKASRPERNLIESEISSSDEEKRDAPSNSKYHKSILSLLSERDVVGAVDRLVGRK
jgi:hypothetical protein